MSDTKVMEELHETPVPTPTKQRGGRIYHWFKEFLFGGRHFCCCIPTRFGVVAGSLLQFLIAGALAIILWFEVSTEHDFTFSQRDRVGFICAGLLETLLFVAAVLGFVGAIVRKQLFVTSYCIFLYVHFVINLGAAAWLTWKIDHVTSTDSRAACDAIKNPGTASQCKDLLGGTKGVLLFVFWAVILVEFYGLLIVTRYARQLRNEKQHGGGHSYTSIGGEFGNRRHSRAESRRKLVLSDESDDQYAWQKSLSPVRTPGPGSAGSTYKGPSATYFPLTPKIPMGYGGATAARHSDEDVVENAELYGAPRQIV